MLQALNVVHIGRNTSAPSFAVLSPCRRWVAVITLAVNSPVGSCKMARLDRRLRSGGAHYSNDLFSSHVIFLSELAAGCRAASRFAWEPRRPKRNLCLSPSLK